MLLISLTSAPNQMGPAGVGRGREEGMRREEEVS